MYFIKIPYFQNCNKIVKIDQPVFNIGRGKHNNLILDDERCSRYHAVILLQNSEIKVRNDSPKGETIVNGKAIDDICHLDVNDTILIGNTMLSIAREEKKRCVLVDLEKKSIPYQKILRIEYFLVDVKQHESTTKKLAKILYERLNIIFQNKSRNWNFITLFLLVCCDIQKNNRAKVKFDFANNIVVLTIEYSYHVNVRGLLENETISSYLSSTKEICWYQEKKQIKIIYENEINPSEVRKSRLAKSETHFKKSSENMVLKNKIKHDLARKYHITGLIGQGGMGAIFQGRNKNGKLVAVKTVSILLSGHRAEKAVGRLKREANYLSAIKSKKIVDIIETIDVEDRVYVVMEFIKGCNLEIFVKNCTFSFPDLLKISIQILDVLEIIHSKGIIHRDLKPENIMIINKNLDVKLLDFGLAKAIYEDNCDLNIETLTKENIVGTLPFMAPEQIDNDVTIKTDVYAFGVLMYKILCGEYPIYSTITSEFICNIIGQKPENLRSKNLIFPIPKQISSIIMRCLDKNPNKRPSVEKIIDILKRT